MNTQLSMHSPTWLLSIHLLKTLKGLREEKAHKKNAYRLASVNSAIIMNCATLIEGCVKDMLYEKVKTSKVYHAAIQKKDKLTILLFKEAMARVLKASWKPLREQAPSIIQKDLGSFYTKDWISIERLFDFRNVLAHGNNISYMVEIEKDLEKGSSQVLTEWSCSALQKFLISKKLIIDESKPGQIITEWQFLKNEIADHFLQHTKGYLTNFANQPYSKSKHLLEDLQEL